ncbi:MAG: YD repeat-containing protein [Myxococcota bacterium]
MLIALLGAAFALPPAYLSPDGPAWLGPLPPRQLGGALRGAPWTDAIVVVSPLDGSLWIQEQDLAGQTRVWSGGEWTVDGVRIASDWPPGDAVGYQLVDGALWGVSSVGGSERLRYDGDGRITMITWADGSRMEVDYDVLGRVASIVGPGLSRWRLDWGSSLRAQDALGHLTTFHWRTGPEGQILEVQDPLGRSARTFYSDDPEPQLLGWEDPRGLQTRIQHTDSLLTVADGVGKQWRIGVDAQRRPTSVELPGGRRWTWERDAGGLLTRMQDPSGRTVRWEREGRGFITAISDGGSPLRLSRDPAGRVIAITDPTGAITRLSRDSDGLISEIIDATGNALGIERYANGMPMAILSRTGGRWGLGLDLQGRPDRLIDPTDRVIEFHRDGLGWLYRLIDGRYGEVRLDRRSDGVLTRITGVDGEQTGLIRDAAGRVAKVRLPGGETMRLSRDVLGELTGVTYRSTPLTIRRDAAGLPTTVGDITWTREPDGAVRTITTPAMSLQIQRDSAGRLHAMESDGWWLRVERDLSGRPIHWEGTDGVVVAIRDAAGRISVEQGIVETTALRDPRGLLNRLSVGADSWQWLRDAAGRPMRLLGPGALALGVDRDTAGRISLLRLPDGTLLRRRWAGAVVLEQLMTSAGRILSEQLTELDDVGRVRSRKGPGSPDEHWRYSLNGTLTTIERGETAWVWGDDQITGDRGELMLLDGQGRLVEARLTEAQPAWGVGRGLLSVFWDEVGQLSEVSGELGVVSLEYDPIGRLVGLRSLDGARWGLSYDARGRLSQIIAPDGVARTLTWAPEAFDGWWDGTIDTPLSDGTPILATPGAAMTASSAWIDFIGGDRWWAGETIDGTAEVLPIFRTPMGLSDEARDGLIDSSGGLRPLPGGPIVLGGAALDPVSGGRLDGLPSLPWTARPVHADPRAVSLDPEPWAPQNSWGEPLVILSLLGELAPVDVGAWMAVDPAPGAVYWLPPSLEGGQPPLGPDGSDLPLTEDPITEALIRALLPGGTLPEPSLVLEAILDEEREPLGIPPGVSLSWFSEDFSGDR